MFQVLNMRWAACAEQKRRCMHHSWSGKHQIHAQMVYTIRHSAWPLSHPMFDITAKWDISKIDCWGSLTHKAYYNHIVIFHVSAKMRYQPIACVWLVAAQKKYYKNIEMSHDKHFTIILKNSFPCMRNVRFWIPQLSIAKKVKSYETGRLEKHSN